MTHKDIEKFLELNEKGRTSRQIAVYTGFSHTCVRNYTHPTPKKKRFRVIEPKSGGDVSAKIVITEDILLCPPTRASTYTREVSTNEGCTEPLLSAAYGIYGIYATNGDISKVTFQPAQSHCHTQKSNASSSTLPAPRDAVSPPHRSRLEHACRSGSGHIWGK